MTARPAKNLNFIVEQGANQRLDLWLSERVDLSRSQLKKLIDEGNILINGVTTKSGHRIQVGDEITVTIPQKQTPSLQPESIPLEIIYEDDWLAVINKPKGLVVHPGAGNWEGTLVNALLFHMESLSGGDELRPGIVHRLDKDTSGLMMIAKTEASYTFLTQQLRERAVKREYFALVHGVLAEEEGIIDRPLGRHPKDRKRMTIVETGREAQTRYQVLERFKKHSLVSCHLVTGRTHQIRVHLASLHHPIVGDPVYGFKTNNLGACSQVLQAVYLGFQHPQGEYLEFRLEPDPWFHKIIQKARFLN